MLSLFAFAATLFFAGSTVAQTSSCPSGTTTIVSPFCAKTAGDGAVTACYDASTNSVSCTFPAHSKGALSPVAAWLIIQASS